jgi:hypothetical protein
MQKKKRLAIALALKNAKPYLSRGNDGKEEFICYSIELGNQFEPYRVALAKDLIMERLDGCATAEEWLNHRVGAYPERSAAGRRVLQAWRHRWLDALITEFS